jgi:hypothetical protein
MSRTVDEMFGEDGALSFRYGKGISMAQRWILEEFERLHRFGAARGDLGGRRC